VMSRYLFIILIWVASFHSLAAQDIYMVSSVSSPWKNVSRSDLRDLFIGKTKSLQRIPCTPVILSKNPDYSLFIREIVRKTPQSFERNWKKLLFSGKATLPLRVDNLENVYRLLRKNDQKVSFSLTQEEVDGINFILIR
jgi:hypothetical protein